MIRSIAAVFFSMAVFSGTLSARPNIVFILADDMGYADLACYGAPDAKTPQIDQLVAEGVKFTNFYAMGPECTPSRTSILTGRYPQRAGGMECAIGTGNVGRYDEAIALAEHGDLGLPAELAVLAPALQKSGYTNAVFGKWHLGYEPKFSPLDQGFAEFTGFLGGNVSYFRHIELSPLKVYLEGREPVEREGYTTHLITDDAIDFLNRRSEEKADPFFLYLPHAAPHFPFQGPKDDTSDPPTADEWTAGTRLTYVSMLEDLDAEVGRLLKALDENGQADNTLVIFASDHGAMKPGLNTPWRDFKGTLFDGGIRVPCIARWPGKLKPGTVSTQVGCLMDLTASFLRIAEAETPDAKGLDGIDILKHVEEERPDQPRTLYWRSRRDDKTWWAIRDGDLKYLRKKDGDQVEDWMFDLSTDGSEETSILGTQPDEAIRLQQKLIKWEQEVMPMR